VVAARRGEVWTIAGGAGRLSAKPRPAIIVGSDLFADLDFVTTVPLTTQPAESVTRVPIGAAEAGIAQDSFAMADKLHTIARSNLGESCGRVSTATMLDVERAILVYLDIAR
jgi:mRNA interferase MazF